VAKAVPKNQRKEVKKSALQCVWQFETLLKTFELCRKLGAWGACQSPTKPTFNFRSS